MRHDVVRRRFASLRECGRARHDPHHLRGQPAEVVASLLVVDVDELLELPLTRKVRDLGLEIGGRVPGQALGHVRLGVGHLRVDVVVDEQPPHVLVGVAADELLDIDASIAERAALPIGGGDRRLDRDDPLETWLEVVHLARKSIDRVAAAWLTE